MTTAQLVTTILSYVVGAGGLLAFIIQWATLRKDNKKDTVETWQGLYEKMQESSNKYEAANEKLREEVDELHRKVFSLTVDLEGYKHFERYVAELEVYSSSLLSVIEPLVSEESFKKLKAAKPVRVKVKPDAILGNDSTKKNTSK